jgi:hypothetical protein
VFLRHSAQEELSQFFKDIKEKIKTTPKFKLWILNFVLYFLNFISCFLSPILTGSLLIFSDLRRVPISDNLFLFLFPKGYLLA